MTLSILTTGIMTVIKTADRYRPSSPKREKAAAKPIYEVKRNDPWNTEVKDASFFASFGRRSRRRPLMTNMAARMAQTMEATLKNSQEALALLEKRRAGKRM
jgi:hypothetical protein